MKLNLATIPLIDRPDVDTLISDGTFEPFTDYAVDMVRYGYCKIDLRSEYFDGLCRLAVESLFDIFRDDLELWHTQNGPSPRQQDAWKSIQEVREIAVNNVILSVLEKLYGRKPFPFQTLNFPVGSQQAFHSDALHFHSYPHGFMCGVWTAMEDVSSSSGPLIFYPGSHRLPYVSAESLGLSPQEVDAESHPQRLFQETWERYVRLCELKREIFLPRMSEVLVWHANLLHGGDIVLDRGLTRWSQVTHYYFDECVYTTPMYSFPPRLGGVRLRNPYSILTGSHVLAASDLYSLSGELSG